MSKLGRIYYVLETTLYILKFIFPLNHYMNTGKYCVSTPQCVSFQVAFGGVAYWYLKVMGLVSGRAKV